MKRIPAFPALLLVLCFQVLFSGCAAGPPLRVGIAPGYPPMAFLEEGVLKGVEPDLARQVAERTGREVVFEILPFNRLIPALQEGRIDTVMAGMSVTPEREQEVGFTTPYLRVGQMLLIREQDIRRFPRALFDRTAGVRIGVERGSTGEAYALRTFAWSTVTHFASTEEAVAALEERKIDCFIHDAPTIWRFSANITTQHQGLTASYEPLTDEPLAWAVRRGDTPLLTQLNDVLARMRQDGSLRAILVRWVPTQVRINPAP
ncbi:transporter substrate-binding domain-containing protein [Trichlorobacter ammonificans]|uniref:Extracellular solute-binding protein family 3 n=1 Tax=Trichlorobacter ammonificans TaxID=2916410 RepID=A0ABN8HJV8_9BACT|nr:transporter substrate-binding domain-containing protein [Trichlorobacter ammonificans]CAH2031615.1 Extracellular solute-binding protein family 3 [Trichlorobacter ammonificans]